MPGAQTAPGMPDAVRHHSVLALSEGPGPAIFRVGRAVKFNFKAVDLGICRVGIGEHFWQKGDLWPSGTSQWGPSCGARESYAKLSGNQGFRASGAA